MGYNYITPKHFPPTPTQYIGFTLAWVTGVIISYREWIRLGWCPVCIERALKVSARGWHGDGIAYGVAL